MTEEWVSANPIVTGVLRDTARLEALAAARDALSSPDADFDEIAALAAGLFGAPIALVTLLGATDQWFVSRHGTNQLMAPSADSFCSRLLIQRDVLVVLDASAEEAFRSLPSVGNPSKLRFYAGAPILRGDQIVGTVCVFDTVSRQEIACDLVERLRGLGRLASSVMRLKEEARARALDADAVSRQERRHAMALDAANVGSWLWNIRTGEVSGNAALRDMLELEDGREISARRVFAAIDPLDRHATLGRLRAALSSGKEYDGLFRVRPSGRWLLGRGRVHERDAQGRPLFFLGINLDVTESQATAERMRTLLRELNHRVKNTLAMLQSLARQTLRQTSNPAEFMEAFAGRLQAISEGHGLLSDHEWGTIRLNELLRAQLLPYVEDYDRQIEIHKDEVRLGPDQAIGLGLVLHELTTNARRFGALSVPRGKVVITARVAEEDGEQVLHMTWHETGGPAVRPPRHRGFGSILIERSLDKVLGSSVHVEFLPQGLTAVIRLPLDQR
ncbi:GAF domain-containing protein [Rhizobium sp. TRM95111]|uniref:sensor histidine kinase n=1 Tax=Rhizobium alarense TaxID=2846851 RepID=UPI001F1B5CF0|nr:HWE histidine kinase domain-containing protein [Rhizobium alarense]MCF3641419.1 GAF domain-containing protein [Rhizobium alarense]